MKTKTMSKECDNCEVRFSFSKKDIKKTKIHSIGEEFEDYANVSGREQRGNSFLCDGWYKTPYFILEEEIFANAVTCKACGEKNFFDTEFSFPNHALQIIKNHKVTFSRYGDKRYLDNM